MDGTVDGRTRKGRRVLEQLDRDGRDEMNLAEFPIASLSDRLPKELKTLEFEDDIDDPLTGELVVRRLTISGSDRYGLPTALDDEVIVGLIQLTRRAGFESPTVYFSRYELIRVLGWEDEGKSYARIETAINRWCGVTLYWDNAWWEKEEQAWANVKFGILDNAVLLDRRRYERKRKLGQVPLALSTFKWNEVVFRSFQAGNLKNLDMELFRSLRSSVAKRLYRFLDKRFYHRSRWEFNLHEFAFEKIGLSRTYSKNAAKIREKLESGIEELEASGYLEPLPPDERYVQLGKGHWKVIFVRRQSAEKANQPEEGISGLEAALVERGVAKKAASEFVARFETGYLNEKLELHDWLVGKKDERIAKNPGGYLAAAIRDDYAFPKGFKTKAKREEERAANASKKAQAAAEKDLKEASRRRAEEERRRPLWEYWNGLSSVEQSALEMEAVEQADSFRRKRYLASHESGDRESAAMYREMILLDYIERVILKLVPSEEEIAALET